MQNHAFSHAWNHGKVKWIEVMLTAGYLTTRTCTDMLHFLTKQTTANGMPETRPVAFRLPASSRLSGKRMNVPATVWWTHCCKGGGGLPTILQVVFRKKKSELKTLCVKVWREIDGIWKEHIMALATFRIRIGFIGDRTIASLPRVRRRASYYSPSRGCRIGLSPSPTLNAL